MDTVLALAPALAPAPVPPFPVNPKFDPPNSPFLTVSPTDLPSWLTDDSVLILDIRPYLAFHSSRLPRALSLSVPTTLLKRPVFSLDRLSAMLSNPAARSRFASWASASRILVYDADSSAIPESSIIYALLRKFKNEGFTRDLAWLRGGFQALVREARDIVDTQPESSHPDPDDEDDNDISLRSNQSILRPNRLPMNAFTLSSTTLSINSPSHFNSAPIASKVKPPGPLAFHPPPTLDTMSLARPAFNPFFDVVRQNIELSHGITERIPLCLPRRVRRRIQDLPFRWLQNIAKHAASSPRQHGSSDALDSEDTDEDEVIDQNLVDEGAEALALQFYRIELAEQRRLMSIMDHHTKESGNDGESTSSLPFPFSITAGIEKGEKNRYRHIWPFEHARVRLHRLGESEDDYVNASYVQPLGTRRRYIATQGPLPASYQDFWTLCWEQNVHVIVMLTREVEGSMVKCGAYWTDTSFGPLRLRLISTAGQVPKDNNANYHAGYFAPHSTEFLCEKAANSHPHCRKAATIKRVFELTHIDYPHIKPRKVIHLQYLEWPDMTVPDDPRGVLGLIKDVEAAVAETSAEEENIMSHYANQTNEDMLRIELDESSGIAKHAMGSNSPVLLHCSAGVGRTGGFIAVDAILDAVRRELRRKGMPNRVDRFMRDRSAHSNTFRHRKNPSPPRSVIVSSSVTDEVVESKTPMQVHEILDDSSGSDRESHLLFPQMNGTHESSLSPNIQGRAAGLPSALPPRSDSSSSSDEFKESDSIYHQYQSSLAMGMSPSVKSLPNDLRMLSVPDMRLRKLSPSPIDSSLHSHSYVSSPLVNPPTSRIPDESIQVSMKIDVPESRYSITSSDDGDSVSRSGSPSADDESESNSNRLQQDVYFLPPASSSPPNSTSPLTFNEPVQKRPTNSIHYKEPRKLHDDRSPIDLSSFDKPIWEVVQDMREQRMSLCQSLRQYVFVHVAIIEGALIIADEEKQRIQELEKELHAPSMNATFDSSAIPVWHSTPVTPQTFHSAKHVYEQESGLGARQAALFVRSSNLIRSISTGKRVASPTELPKENKQGEVLLSKRPSIQSRNLEC
ncbi:hypothetical protein AMATHDRAFT_231 [Amanita thiersii Skay4041]|uniref:protein-tyrosine-phosphatase n=1 Tax=Amanita thiersii Skay4041 TaxID=703135 RepID=A0A2A9NVU8_9AGAR|nr:hypothetical protein AMATHDRAFT_231 [Amanita thiersii Skay4041]